MRKLTKIIKKRRKNYKPTTGIVNKNGIRESINTEYIRAARAEQIGLNPFKMYLPD